MSFASQDNFFSVFDLLKIRGSIIFYEKHIPSSDENKDLTLNILEIFFCNTCTYFKWEN